MLDDGHQDEEGDADHQETMQTFDTFTFNPVSLSAGVVWDFKTGYNMGLSLAHAERAPNAAELFSAGPHIAIRTFEVGTLFAINEEEGKQHLDYEGQAKKETSNNIDLSLRKFDGDVGFVVNLFYNKVSNYYSLNNTGLTTDDLFKQEPEAQDAEQEHEHAEQLPVFIYEQEDATLYGLEVELAWRITPGITLTTWGDTVNAKRDNGGYLPRTSPTRLGADLNVERGAWNAQLTALNYFDQKNTAINETATQGYTLMDARVSYAIPTLGGTTTVYIAGTNLTDQEARAHTSYLKNSAPQPGRNFKVGLHATF